MLLRELSTNMDRRGLNWGPQNILENLGVVNVFEVHCSRVCEKDFDILSQKCTLILWHSRTMGAAKHFHVFEGYTIFFNTFMGGCQFFYHHQTFPPPHTAIIVDNSLMTLSVMLLLSRQFLILNI